MRIAFSGSGGTGKTTLLNELNKKLEYPIIGEGIRDWLAEHKFSDFKELSIQDVVKMQEDTLNRKVSVESELETFISDRTTVDNLAYALRWIGSVSTDHDVWMAQYITKAMNHANENYDLIFVMPWGVLELEKDGTRSSKEWYQYMIQALIERHLYMLDTPMIYEMETDSLEDRVKECLRVIEAIKNNPELGLQ